MEDQAGTQPELALDLTVGIVAAYVSNNHVQVGELSALIAATHAALVGLGQKTALTEPEFERPTPAQIRRSISHDHLVSFEDGKSYKTLRRHLTIRGLTPEAYREKWGLPRDYPMTSASYSEQRSELARALGLGQQRRRAPEPELVPEGTPVAEARKPRGRPRKIATT